MRLVYRDSSLKLFSIGLQHLLIDLTVHVPALVQYMVLVILARVEMPPDRLEGIGHTALAANMQNRVQCMLLLTID